MEKQVNALSLFAHQSVSLCKRSDDVFYSVLLHSFESKDKKKKSPLCSSDSFLTVKFLNMLSDGTCQSQSLSKEKLGFYTHSHTFVLAFNARIAGLFFPLEINHRMTHSRGSISSFLRHLKESTEKTSARRRRKKIQICGSGLLGESDTAEL